MQSQHQAILAAVREETRAGRQCAREHIHHIRD
jgi:hypothetical protein